jgi:hypothetical protein
MTDPDETTIRVARAIYAKIDETNSDPWDAAIARRLSHGLSGHTPMIRQAIRYAEAALSAVYEPQVAAGKIGGRLRSDKLSPERRREIAAMGGRAKGRRGLDNAAKPT